MNAFIKEVPLELYMSLYRRIEYISVKQEMIKHLSLYKLSF